MVAMAFALISNLSSTDRSSVSEVVPTQATDLLQSVAVRSFALMTLYLALSSIPFPELGVAALALLCLRATQMLSVFHLVS